MHAITGCDGTSALVGKGKKQAFELVVSDSDMCEAMLMVGRSFDDYHDKQQGCARFVCSLYGHSGEDTDSVRFKLFCSKNYQTCHLPPAKVSDITQKRISHQACIWRRSLKADALSSDGHGWDLTEGHLSIHWMDQQPAPKAILKLLSCNGKKDHCLGRRCLCHRNGMSSTDAVGCKECANLHSTV